MSFGNMFSLGPTCGGGNFNIVDPLEERDPPAEPTPATFPNVCDYNTRQWSQSAPPSDLQYTFSHVFRPTDITSRHIEALNIDLLPPCQPQQLVPANAVPDGSLYFGKTSQSSAPREIDMINAPRQRDLDLRIAELKIDNHAAYRTIQRQPPRPGEKPQRVAYMRKFYEGLESMSQYWDCSLDQHYELLPPSPANSIRESERKRQRHFYLPRRSSESSRSSGEQKHRSSRKDSAIDLSPRTSDEQDRLTRSPSCTPEPRPRIRYKGFRTNTGREMPESFRFNTIRGFVEQAVWPFKANLAPPRRQPLVKINNLYVPVRQSAMVHRIPMDREKTRRGIVEGPIMGLQIRHELEFAEDQPGRAWLDQVREIGGLLQLAQERRRQGCKEVRSGEGKWWTTTPRFGASLEVEPHLDSCADNSTDVLTVVEEVMMGRREKGASLRNASMQKMTPALLWQELKPSSEKWDPRTDYQAIGRDPESPYDEVFMVSALNHHISILKLTVHDAYMNYLENASILDPLPAEADWCHPKLERSAWFDIFDVEQRVEAFKTIADVMIYLTRVVKQPPATPSTASQVEAATTTIPTMSPSSTIAGQNENIKPTNNDTCYDF